MCQRLLTGQGKFWEWTVGFSNTKVIGNPDKRSFGINLWIELIPSYSAKSVKKLFHRCQEVWNSYKDVLTSSYKDGSTGLPTILLHPAELTVTEADLPLPHWAAEGMIYQDISFTFTNIWTEWLILISSHSHSDLIVLVYAKSMDPDVVIIYLPFSFKFRVSPDTFHIPFSCCCCHHVKGRNRDSSYSQVSYEPNSLSSPGQQITKVLVPTMSSGRIKYRWFLLLWISSLWSICMCLCALT